MDIKNCLFLAESLRIAKGETLSERLASCNYPDIIAVQSNRGHEVLIFTDKENCMNYGGFLSGERIINHDGERGTIKGAGFAEADFQHGRFDGIAGEEYTVWIALDKHNGKVTYPKGFGKPFNLRDEGFIGEDELETKKKEFEQNKKQLLHEGWIERTNSNGVTLFIDTRPESCAEFGHTPGEQVTYDRHHETKATVIGVALSQGVFGRKKLWFSIEGDKIISQEQVAGNSFFSIFTCLYEK